MDKHSLNVRERITAIIGALLLFALVGGSYYYSVKVSMDNLKYVPSSRSPDFTAKNVALTDFDEKGAADRRMTAATMDHFSDESVRASTARYYSLNPADPQLTMESDKAWSDDGMETLEFSGNVKVRREPSDKDPELYFSSEYARAWLDTRRIDSDRPVLLRRGTDTTTAEKGIKYDDVNRTVELFDQVHSVIHTNSGLDGSAGAAKQ
jgi:lipopolysaccharide export system protein LptC